MDKRREASVRAFLCKQCEYSFFALFTVQYPTVYRSVCLSSSPTEASPSRLQPQRDMTIPVIACIVLGALLFVVLVLLAGQLQHNRMLRRGREQIPLKRRELRKVTHSGPSALF